MPWKGEATKPSCDVKHRKSWLINEKIPKIMLYELMHRLKLFYHSFYKRKSTLFSTGHFKNSQRSYLFVLCGDFFFLAGCLNSEASPRSESTQPVSNLWHATNGSMQIMLWGCFPVGQAGYKKAENKPFFYNKTALSLMRRKKWMIYLHPKVKHGYILNISNFSMWKQAILGHVR